MCQAWRMELIYEFTMRAQLGETLIVGPTAVGVRMVVGVTAGTAHGDRINGEFIPPGGDWITIGPDGYGRLDVRAQLRTTDGAVIYVHYTGVLEMAKVQDKMLSGEEGSFDDAYFRTTPRLETGDERYAWVNHTVFVGRGRVLPGAVEYEVFRVT